MTNNTFHGWTNTKNSATQRESNFPRLHFVRDQWSLDKMAKTPQTWAKDEGKITKQMEIITFTNTFLLRQTFQLVRIYTWKAKSWFTDGFTHFTPLCHWEKSHLCEKSLKILHSYKVLRILTQGWEEKKSAFIEPPGLHARLQRIDHSPHCANDFLWALLCLESSTTNTLPNVSVRVRVCMCALLVSMCAVI